jgi:probable HAF family extracellular repeat protein
MQRDISRVQFVLAAAVIWLAVPNIMLAAQYTVTDLGVLPNYTFESGATAINNAGQVVGFSVTSSQVVHAFLYSNGQMQDLGAFPGDTYTLANGINNNGQVVGWSAHDNFFDEQINTAFLYSNSSMATLGTFQGAAVSQATAINDSGTIAGWSATGSAESGFLYNNGNTTYLGMLSGAAAIPLGINNSGQAVGTTDNGSGLGRAFIYSGGNLSAISPLPGYTLGQANAINNAGQVVGFSYNEYTLNFSAFLYSNNTLTNLGTLGGNAYGYQATSINDSGQIVGTATADNDSPVGGFLYEAGAMEYLNDLIPSNSGWNLESATSINDRGQIVGSGYIDGQLHAYLITPIPEPGSILMVALAGVGLYRRPERRHPQV